MSNIKPVTTSQTDGIAKMANEKRIHHDVFQKKWIDEGEVSRSLDALKMRTVAEQYGARIHTVRTWVISDRPWDEAVNAAGPNTPADYNIRKVGNLFLPTGGTDEVEQEHIFLNCLDGQGSWDKALTWGKEVKLLPTVPREVFADGEQHPYLHRILGVNPVYVVATTECTFWGYRRACCVWWRGSKREAYLDPVEDFGDADGWFAFRKPLASDLRP